LRCYKSRKVVPDWPRPTFGLDNSPSTSRQCVLMICRSRRGVLIGVCGLSCFVQSTRRRIPWTNQCNVHGKRVVELTMDRSLKLHFEFREYCPGQGRDRKLVRPFVYHLLSAAHLVGIIEGPKCYSSFQNVSCRSRRGEYGS